MRLSTIRWLKRMVILGIFFWLITEARERQRVSHEREALTESEPSCKSAFFKSQKWKSIVLWNWSPRIFCLKVLIRQSKLAYSKISQICDQTFGTYFGQETPKNRKFDTQKVGEMQVGDRLEKFKPWTIFSNFVGEKNFTSLSALNEIYLNIKNIILWEFMIFSQDERNFSFF